MKVYIRKQYIKINENENLILEKIKKLLTLLARL